jgi:hypothetical protein
MFVLAMTSVDRVLTHSPKYCCWTSKSFSKPRPQNNEFTTLNTNRSEGRNGNERRTVRILTMSENNTIHVCLALEKRAKNSSENWRTIPLDLCEINSIIAI